MYLQFKESNILISSYNNSYYESNSILGIGNVVDSSGNLKLEELGKNPNFFY